MPGGPSGRLLRALAKRLVVTMGLAVALALVLGQGFRGGVPAVLRLTATIGLVALAVFACFERWPRRLPTWVARWVLQVVGVGFAVPITAVTMFALAAKPGAPAL